MGQTQVLFWSANGALQAWHTSAYVHAAQLAIELGLLRPPPHPWSEQLCDVCIADMMAVLALLPSACLAIMYRDSCSFPVCLGVKASKKTISPVPTKLVVAGPNWQATEPER